MWADPVDELPGVTARYGGREMQLNAYVKIDESAVVLLGLGDFGQEIVTVEYNGKITVAHGAVAAGIAPEYVVMDPQLVYYDGGALKTHLRRRGLVFEEIDSPVFDSRTKRLLKDAVSQGSSPV